MYNMKEASVRQLQHHFNQVVQWVDHGEEVRITRRRKVIARLIPDRPLQKKILWPDFVSRSHSIIKRKKGKSLADTVLEAREGLF